MEVLAVILLAVRNDRFCFTEFVEHDHELSALDLLHFAGEQIADAAREFVADLRSLALAYALNDPLLGRLNGGPAELGEIDGNLQLVADLEIRILETGFLE